MDTIASELLSGKGKKCPLDLVTWRDYWLPRLSWSGEDVSQIGMSWVNRG